MRYHVAWVFALLFIVTHLLSLVNAGFFNLRSQKDSSKAIGSPKAAAVHEHTEEYDAVVPYDYDSTYQDATDLINHGYKNYIPRRPVPGSSLQTRRRNLGAWKLADFLLVGTVDGSLHARDRYTGVERWTIPGEGPLVQVNKGADFDNMPTKESDLTWIIEPMGDGALYYFTEDEGLNKLPVSIKQLVAESPFALTGDDKIYTGTRKTTLYSINATTGEIMRVFGGGQHSLGKPVCKVRYDVELEEEENQDNGSFMIGKTDYNLAIYGKNDTIWNVTFSSWGPNNMDADLAEQYVRSMDSVYVTPVHDDSILALSLETKAAKPAQWVGRISSMAVEVFDVIRSPTRDPNDPLVLLHQPEYPFDEDDKQSGWKASGTYVERTKNGQWYALSGEHFPSLVNSAPVSKWCEMRVQGKHKKLRDEELWNSLVGVHLDMNYNQYTTSAGSTSKSTPFPGIGPGSQRLGIEGPTETKYRPDSALDYYYQDYYGSGRSRKRRGHPVEQTRPSSLPLIPDPPKISPEPVYSTGWNLFTKIFENILTVAVLVGMAALIRRFGWAPALLALWNRIAAVNEPAREPGVEKDELVEQVEQVVVSEPNEEVNGTKTPEEKPLETPETPKPEKSEAPLETPETPKPETPKIETSEDEPDVKENYQADETPKKVEIVEPDWMESPSKEKRKRKRGTRGGKRNKRAQREEEKEETEEALPEVEVVSQSTGTGKREDDTILQVDEHDMLGKGSQGTVVFGGTFQGRAVAVKRMVLAVSDVASREILSLQEADSHNNIVRYYCQKQENGFLYIALARCAGTLQDWVQQRLEEEVIGKVNKAAILKQITEGLQHLHSLKLVHRDIKPQNILAEYRKKKYKKGADGKDEVEIEDAVFVISDFGLCKKLEEDQSTFGMTTHQVAGTSGWIAPEINRRIQARAGLINSDGTSSSELLSNSAHIGSRLTRKVDIFSLGCVFYFVLTGGSHPFGDDVDREVNITQGNYNLDEIEDFPEAQDLIALMIAQNPKDRPTADEVLKHPFFWDAEERLKFIDKFSDWMDLFGREHWPELTAEFELRCRPLVEPLGEFGWRAKFGQNHKMDAKDFAKVQKVFKNDNEEIDWVILEDLVKRRGYQGQNMVDFARAIRNKHSHYHELHGKLSDRLKPKIQLPDRFLDYFMSKFPKLFMIIYYFSKAYLHDQDLMKEYF